MGKVIAIAQQKGGAGKTMLTAQLATALAETAKVAVLDIDPQGSLSKWGMLRAAAPKTIVSVTTAATAGWRLDAELQKLKSSHDIVLIDTPPVVDSDARRAIRGADLVLVPLNPALPDLWAAEATIKLAIAEKRALALVFNRASASRLRRRVESVLSARGLMLLNTTLGNRIGFANAFADGYGVTETGPNTAAAMEIRALAACVVALLP